MNLSKRILIAILVAAQSPVATWAVEPVSTSTPAAVLTIDDASVLENSQVSYRAEGGFSGVESYGAIISCVKGEISVMASIHDPRSKDGEPTRKICHMSKDRYLALWKDIVRQAGLKLPDGPTLKKETLDEFTVTFNLSVGQEKHQFRAQGLSLPECARYEAVRCLIDDATQMADVWKAHDEALGIVKTNDAKVTFETLQSDLELQP